MQYPFSVGDLNILGILDSGADYLLVDPEIWGQLEGEKVSEPIGYLGVSGVWQQIESAKMVVFRVEDGQTSWLAYCWTLQSCNVPMTANLEASHS